MHAATSNHPHVTSVFDQEASADLHITGSPHLLRRLFRNAFENAFSFAQATVTTTVQQTADGLRILIQDDGPGLSAEALASFGKKKSFTRYRAAVGGGRPSVGLGSVILKTIAAAHGGEVSIRNVLNQNGKPCGAELTIFLATSIKIAV